MDGVHTNTAVTCAGLVDDQTAGLMSWLRTKCPGHGVVVHPNSSTFKSGCGHEHFGKEFVDRLWCRLRTFEKENKSKLLRDQETGEFICPRFQCVFMTRNADGTLHAVTNFRYDAHRHAMQLSYSMANTVMGFSDQYNSNLVFRTQDFKGLSADDGIMPDINDTVPIVRMGGGAEIFIPACPKPKPCPDEPKLCPTTHQCPFNTCPKGKCRHHTKTCQHGKLCYTSAHTVEDEAEDDTGVGMHARDCCPHTPKCPKHMSCKMPEKPMCPGERGAVWGAVGIAGDHPDLNQSAVEYVIKGYEAPDTIQFRPRNRA